MKHRPIHGSLAEAKYRRLQGLSRAQKRSTAELIQLYVQEGFLRRLSLSRYGRSFVLKGGMLLAAFDLRRTTRDVDLLALGPKIDTPTVQRLIAEVVSAKFEDGVNFLRETIVVAGIRINDASPGVRVTLEAHFASAIAKFSVDVSVGDPIVPPPMLTTIPMLLGGEPIEVLAYPKAMVIAEKVVTAIQWGQANTRWRDFADLYLLLQSDLVEDQIIEALRTVAHHRRVRLQPLNDRLKEMGGEAQSRWATWLSRQDGQGRFPGEFALVLKTLQSRVDAWIHKAAEGGLPSE